MSEYTSTYEGACSYARQADIVWHNLNNLALVASFAQKRLVAREKKVYFSIFLLDAKNDHICALPFFDIIIVLSSFH